MKRIALDIVYVTLFACVMGVPLAAVGALHLWLAGGPLLGLPAWAAYALLPGYYVLTVLGLVVMLGLLQLLLPRLRPGRYAFPRHRMVGMWMARFALMRIAHFPLWRSFIYSVATLRWAMLSALGAHVALDFDSGSDVQVLDPQLIRVARGCMLASGTVLCGHFVDRGELILGEVHLAEGVQLSGNVIIAPGTTIGAKSLLGPECRIGVDAKIGAGVRLGGGCALFTDVTIGDGAVLGNQVSVAAGARIGAGARVAAGTRVPKGAVIADGARFPVTEES